MQYVPLATFLLWLLIAASFRFFPEIALQEYIKYPLIILLSVLLPVSFWLTQQNPRKRFWALVFAGIFLFNTGMVIFALAHNYSTLALSGNNSEQKILPDLAELLTTEKSAEKRRLVARIFSRKYGVSVPYKVEDNEYALYLPNQTDIEHYRANSASSAEKETARMNLSSQIIELFFLLNLHVGIFILIIVFLILYEQKRPAAEIIGSGLH